MKIYVAAVLIVCAIFIANSPIDVFDHKEIHFERTVVYSGVTLSHQ